MPSTKASVASSTQGRRQSHRRARTDIHNGSVLVEALELENSTGGLPPGDDKRDNDVAYAKNRRSAALSVELKQVATPGHRRNVSVESAESAESAVAVQATAGVKIEEKSRFMAIIDLWRDLDMGETGMEHNAAHFVSCLEANMMVVEALGAAFGLINMDVRKNCEKISQSCIRHNAITIQRMLDAEGSIKGLGSGACLWMKRMLQFSDVMLTEFCAGRDLPQAVETAYRESLHDAHPFVVRALAGNIRLLVPSRKVFCARLDPDEKKVMDGIREFLVIFKPKLKVLVEEFNNRGYEKVKKCKAGPRPISFLA
mmetsp:Transcript_26133/g.63488  ORF Transcript_26133/g.63488 Transcript_26133/m.63488 type:complete len:313 (+) Transcript_26133:242-1180(+)|eukprot:CAMPEP_0198309994 /NCGR_PEP_ID=MMETSP1450-20131203/2198_1 /TAXON_ID=753684 ORGANISM="Madagascaria erythrocladiodes, Strain CCMP3234" /NCGR_SAMPLE_ID=MMETSP1450 /ASSEMBLY_ACC=CAM_ASM_001115 /LENGTH=312 /DNA_ID=CAMNT_0044012779 /DNA_START=122 /DNA_END=1060 /DNA_ORIENTATION=+